MLVLLGILIIFYEISYFFHPFPRYVMLEVIASIRIFGNRTNFHPHLHFPVAEGGANKTGIFYKIPRIDDSRLSELYGGGASRWSSI